MDKYEYSLKTEQLKKYALEGIFDEEALEICESINWKKEKDVEILSIISKVYETYRKYEKALSVLERMYKISNAKRRNAYRIISVALEAKDYDIASDYLEEYKRLAPRDTKSIFLEYHIAKGRLYSQSISRDKEIQGLKQLLPILEKYIQEEYDEEGMYELAEVYHKVGMKDACVAMCDQIATWFSVGTYVEKALRLKTVYVPLSEEQREMIQNQTKYEERLKEFVNDLKEPDEVPVFTTKEEAKERAKKKASQKEKKKEKDVLIMTSLDNFTEKAKSIHNKAEKVSVDSMESVRKLQEDYKQKAEEVKNTSEEQEEKIELEEKQQLEFNVNISEEIDVSNIGDLTAIRHFVVKCDSEKKGIQLAAEVIGQKILQGESIHNEITYTTGEKLNQAGIEESLTDVSNILFIKQAGTLSDVSLWNLQLFMEKPDTQIHIVLIDTDNGIESLWKKNITIQNKFDAIFSGTMMSVDELADYAVEYAERKNCVLHEMAYIPLYDIIEMIVDDKKGDEKKRVEDFMNYVIENASGRRFMQVLRNLLFVRQDDQGKMILYEKDFE